jgi:hypothetical protein
MELAKQPFRYQVGIARGKHGHAYTVELSLARGAGLGRAIEDLHNCRGAIIGRYPIDRHLGANSAAMDEHQFATTLAGIFVAAALDRQPNRLHRRAAARQPVACNPPVEVARPQAIWAVITILHTCKRGIAGYIQVAMAANEPSLVSAAAITACVCLVLITLLVA